MKKILTRRHLLQLGLISTGGIISNFVFNSKPALPQIPSVKVTDENDPLFIARNFDYGIIKEENGRKIREFIISAQNKPVKLNEALDIVTWSYNRRVPGPTLRAQEGDRIRVIFYNADSTSHSIHFHGTHPEAMDGINPIRHGKQTIYEFDAYPYGVHLYHCHVEPVTRHISKGLYGMFIIDPPKQRPPADEIVLIMGGYDVNNSNSNTIYAFNGIPDYYHLHPIPIYQNQLVRLYLLNMIEFDPVVTFHLHANMFDVYPTGRTLKPTQNTDVITMGTSERHILEFSYPYTGKYMFHPHQDYIAEKGCMGCFQVITNN